MRALALALLLLAGPVLAAEPEKPAPAVPSGLDVHLTPEQVCAFPAVLDAAIRGSGYSPVTAAALSIGEAVEAAQHLTKH